MNTAVSSPAFNTQESQVQPYQLPELMRADDGSLMNSGAQWTGQRRSEILALFSEHVYGKMPVQDLPAVHYEITEQKPVELPVPAVRRQVTARLVRQGREKELSLLIHLPARSSRPAPVFIGLNFDGNHSVHGDAAIQVPVGWVRNHTQTGVIHQQAGTQGRGAFADRWDIASLIEQGYALITMYYGDLFPDHANGFEDSVHALYSETPAVRQSNGWGAIGAWAWGLSRILDYVETDTALDARRAVAFGHSRLGKAALWAGATDTRFAMTISNNSGCGGASLSRRIFGQTVDRINTSYPYWFAPNFQKYNNHEDKLPVDQHMLLALMAPRLLYVASAKDDLWADPRGEFLSSQHATAAYRLLGLDEPAHEVMPDVHQPIGHHVGYHLRAGPHGVMAYDWQQYIHFANRHLKQSVL